MAIGFRNDSVRLDHCDHRSLWLVGSQLFNPYPLKTGRLWITISRVSISAIYHLFPILQKSHDLIFIYSPGMRDFNYEVAKFYHRLALENYKKEKSFDTS